MQRSMHGYLNRRERSGQGRFRRMGSAWVYFVGWRDRETKALEIEEIGCVSSNLYIWLQIQISEKG